MVTSVSMCVDEFDVSVAVFMLGVVDMNSSASQPASRIIGLCAFVYKYMYMYIL